ncbi:hypothetical protein Taro_014312 [Colocasia esculenta]|uniref:Uncharacterized protein n=1 Tax=Colocasia esculenta TaxID=4460 RepID=A0A843UPR7_COLES|nr:hypothetical protein [Colocasia esculenta]
MFLDEEDLQKLGLKMLEGIRWRSSSIHDALLQWHLDCQFFFFLCCSSAPQSDGTALLPFWMQILYPLFSSLLLHVLLPNSIALLPFWTQAPFSPFCSRHTLFWRCLSTCVDTQVDCVDTTGYCFRTGFWDSELVSTHRLKKFSIIPKT